MLKLIVLVISMALLSATLAEKITKEEIEFRVNIIFSNSFCLIYRGLNRLITDLELEKNLNHFF